MDLEESVKYITIVVIARQPLLLTHSFPSHYRIVESRDARMFGLDDAEVSKRRKYVVYVWKTIEVRTPYPSFLLPPVPLHVLISRNCKSRTWELSFLHLQHRQSTDLHQLQNPLPLPIQRHPTAKMIRPLGQEKSNKWWCANKTRLWTRFRVPWIS